MSNENVKIIIRGTVAEAGIEVQFDNQLAYLRTHYESLKARGEEECAAFILALTYFGVEASEV